LEPALVTVQDSGVEVDLQVGINRVAGGVVHEDVPLPWSCVHGDPAVEVMVSEPENARKVRGPLSDIWDVDNGSRIGAERARIGRKGRMS
jgi:hypothetical protein